MRSFLKGLIMASGLVAGTSAIFAEGRQVVYSCTEAQTLADGPGYQYLVVVGNDGHNGFVNQKPVRMRGNNDDKPWTVLSPNFTVKNSDNGRSLAEVGPAINWEKEESCFVLQSKVIITIGKGLRGAITRGGQIIIDPNQPNCSAPHIARAQPTELACRLY